MQNYGYYPYYFTNNWQNYTNQLQQQQATQQHPIRVILVSNEEEAKATPADQSGNPIIFLNKSLNKIYLKQLNPQTQAAPLQVFSAEIINDNNEVLNPYQKDFNTIIEGINGLYRRIDPLIQQAQQSITTQPPIMTEPEEYSTPKSKGVKNAKQI